MTFDHPIEIHSLTAPLVVESSVRCDGLNADLVDGHHASEFALSSHLHSASDIDRDYFATARLGEGTATGNKVLFAKADGTRGEWRNVSAYDVTDLTDFGIGLAQTLDAPSARTYLGAAPVSHTHHADEVNAGILSVARLGSGTSSAGHVLFGHPSGGTGFWKTLSYSDVNGSVGYGSSTAYRIPYWGSVGRLENSQIVYDPSYTRGVVRGYVNLGTADLGTSGNLYFTDIGDIDESLAVNFKSIVYRKIKATITGSGSVTVTPNDGAQTLTLDIASGYSTVLGNTGAVTVPDTELAETTLIGTIRSGESATFGAGTLPTGSIIKVEAMGTVSAPGNWANGVLRVKFGSSRALAFTLLEEDSHLASGYAWRLTAWLSVTTAGASATTVLSGMLEYEYPSDADTPGVRRLRHLTGTASGTLDTTASNTFNLTWDNATGLEVNWTCNHLLVTRY